MKETWFSFRVVGISKGIYLHNATSLKNRLDKENLETLDGVVLVQDIENKYDPNAIMVMVQQPIGRICIGYVPARRYCNICDKEHSGRGYKSYNDGEEPPTICPKCGEELDLALSERISECLNNDNMRQSSTLKFIGGSEGKENLGAVVRVSFIE